MANPTKGDVHVDAALTNLSLAFMQGEDAFIADRVFPVVPVEKQSDFFFQLNQGDFYRAEMEKRGPGAESAGSGYRVSTQTYFAHVWALHKDIDDQTRANTDSPLNADRNATLYLTQQALLRRDKSFVAAFMATGVWTGDQTGAGSVAANQFVQWSTGGSIPIKDIRAQILVIQRRTGYRPNVLVLGPDVWNVLADHADFLDRIKYSERAIVGPELLAAVLGLDRVVIAGATENTANEGATPVYSFIAPKAALLLYAAPSPGLETVSAGYTFTWTGLLGTNAQGGRIKKFRMEQLESDRVEVEMAFDMKVTAPDLGVYFTTAVV